jgi:hypothetical protein
MMLLLGVSVQANGARSTTPRSAIWTVSELMGTVARATSASAIERIISASRERRHNIRERRTVTRISAKITTAKIAIQHDGVRSRTIVPAANYRSANWERSRLLID